MKPEVFPPVPEDAQDGVLVLSTGAGRRQWLWNCIASVRRHRPDLGIHVVSDVPVDVPHTWVSAMTGKASRFYKTQAYRLSPFPGTTLIFDDDCIMHRPLPPLDEMLAGADLAMKLEPGCGTVAASCKPGSHRWISEAEQAYTAQAVEPETPHYNSGVFLFRRTPAVKTLFDLWHTEWMRFQSIDQLALSRALAKHPIPVTVLSEQYNYRSERRNREDVDPFVFHCHWKRDIAGWYHRKYHPEAKPHAAYTAFSRAVDNGQWSRAQYDAVGRLVHAGAAQRLLVWGCGYDTDLWRLTNRGGRTVFTETDAGWAQRARKAGAEVVEWQAPTTRGVPFDGVWACPAPGPWNAVIIDGPQAHDHGQPGRELPFRWTAEAKPRLIVAHDIERPWERWCVERYLGYPSLWIDGPKGRLGIWSPDALAPELCR